VLFILWVFSLSGEYYTGDEDYTDWICSEMATHGTIGKFDSRTEDWASYTERLTEYFTANDVKSADKKQAILLSGVGPSTYQVILNLVAPDKPTEKTFDQLVKVVKGHYQPTPSVIVQRFKFNTRSQKPGESISSFVAELRWLAEHCDYEATLEDMLRDRLVCGISDGSLQRRLLAEPNLKFKKALEKLKRQSKELQQKQQRDSSALLKVGAKQKHPGVQAPPRFIRETPCYRCGGKYSSAICKFKEATCHSCQKKGHIAKVCRSSQMKQPGRRPDEKPRKIHQVDLDTDDTKNYVSDDPDTYLMFNVQGKPLLVTVQLNWQTVSMELDTGASLSIISEKTYKSLWKNKQQPVLEDTNCRLHTYTKETIRVLGQITVEVTYKEQVRMLPLLVVAGEGPSLLGRDWLTEL